ncbi:MAG: cysteine rich repeat-containing protein [Gallionella sp.]
MSEKTGTFGMLTKWASLLAGVFCLMVAAGASAAGAPAAQNADPCADDIAKLCKGVPATGGQLVQCLSQHSNDVSPACKETLDERKKFQEFVHACNDDVNKLCLYTKRETPKIIQCLRRHQDELSPMCKQKMPPE